MEPLREMPDHTPIDDDLEEHFAEAWRVAFQAARLLRQSHGAQEVRLIGSLLKRDRFHEESDIDLVMPDFAMAEWMEIGPDLDQFLPWVVDVIPLAGMLPAKRRYFLSESQPLEC